MAQHARPIGPTTNTAAAFQPSMVQGNWPDRNRLPCIPRLPPPVSQTTHVAEPFEPSMAQGDRPILPPRLFSSLTRHGLQITQTTHVAAPFEPSMAQGDRPILPPRLFSAPRLPLPVSQTTHVAAPFEPSMAQGDRPPLPRLWLPLRVGWQHAPPTHTAAPITVDMLRGWHPATDVRSQPFTSGRVIPAPDVISFAPESVSGWHPDTPRLFSAPRLPLPVSQPTHDAATFDPSMVAGSRPDRNREQLTLRTGWMSREPDIFAFPPESVYGWHPDTPRIFLAPRIPLPWNQTTHDAAPFGVDMVIGYGPDRNREHLTVRVGWVSPPPDVAIFPPESVYGWHPDAPRIFLAPRLPVRLDQAADIPAALAQEMIAGWGPDRAIRLVGKLGSHVIAPDVPLFSNEMVYGWHPDAPRVFLAPRIPLPLDQSAHLEAPITVDMLEGWQADRGIRLVGKTGYHVTPPDVVAFSVEMGIGWHPDRPRILLASRIPLPWSQPTFDPAAFSSEMVSGSVPSRNREVLPRILGWISTPSDIQAFPLESIYGWLPARPRIFLAPRLPVRLDQAPDIPAPFSLEMVLGTNPDLRRIFLAPRLLWSMSTHLVMPIIVVVAGDGSILSIDLPELGATIILGGGGMGGMT